MHQQLYQLKQDFLTTWPIERLKAMSLIIVKSLVFSKYLKVSL